MQENVYSKKLLKRHQGRGRSTLKVEVPYSLVALTVSGGTLVMFDINSSRKWQLCSRWVVLMITCTNYNNIANTI